ncbi:MAG TPA: YdcF family protein [Bryobacteraceae bacterium]|nr:YdcF family protein [Bryobacteraceae bacterium]
MKRRIRRVWAGLAVLIGCVLAVWLAFWLGTTAGAIQRQSTIDEARSADVIVVLGAAEYRGRPSPVLEARLNHALFLYREGLAPRILTTGGAGGDPRFTEGEVARAYLSKHDIPSEAVIVESEGDSTVYSTAAAAEIMRRLNLHSCIVVSDGYHIYRVKKMLESEGMAVYGSPRPSEPREDWRERWLYFRQAIAFGLWRVGIPI